MLNAGFAVVAAVYAAVVFAQATPTPPDEAEIPPVVWELISFSERTADAVEVEEPERYTAQFLPEGELAVGADCNQAGGTYTAQAGMLEISPLRSTLIGCPADSRVEPFLTLLQTATTFELDDDGMLELTSPDGSLLLRPALTAVIWEWREFRGGDDSVVAPENPEHYTLTFLPDGELAIRADCNRAMGTYAVDGPVLELTVGGTTRVMCPPGSLMDRFLRDLGEVRSHVFRDGNLYLALKVDAGIMEFNARAADPAQATPVAG